MAVTVALLGAAGVAAVARRRHRQGRFLTAMPGTRLLPAPVPGAEPPSPDPREPSPALTGHEAELRTSAGLAGSTATPTPAHQPPQGALKRCRIRCWDGYLWSHFYAEPEDDLGAALALSPSFRRRGREPPGRRSDTEKALAALLDELTERGWLALPHVPGPAGSAWYELTLVRRLPEARAQG